MDIKNKIRYRLVKLINELNHEIDYCYCIAREMYTSFDFFFSISNKEVSCKVTCEDLLKYDTMVIVTKILNKVYKGE